MDRRYPPCTLKPRIALTRRVGRGQIAVLLDLQRHLEVSQLTRGLPYLPHSLSMALRPLSESTHSGGTDSVPDTPAGPGFSLGSFAPGSAAGSSGMRMPATAGYDGIAGAWTIFVTLAYAALAIEWPRGSAHTEEGGE
jgi:hypothetical protein